MPRLFRPFAAALALALLLAGAAQAGPLIPRPARPGTFLDLLLGCIESLRTRPDSSRLSPVWELAGGIMDPDGRDGSTPHGNGQDEGGIMDPNG